MARVGGAMIGSRRTSLWWTTYCPGAALLGIGPLHEYHPSQRIKQHHHPSQRIEQLHHYQLEHKSHNRNYTQWLHLPLTAKHSEHIHGKRDSLAQSSERQLLRQTLDLLDNLLTNKTNGLPQQKSSRDQIWDLCRLLLNCDATAVLGAVKGSDLLLRLLAFLALTPGHPLAPEQVERLLRWQRSVRPNEPGVLASMVVSSNNNMMSSHDCSSTQQFTTQDLVWMVKSYSIVSAQSAWAAIAQICRQINRPTLHPMAIYVAVIAVAVHAGPTEAIVCVRSLLGRSDPPTLAETTDAAATDAAPPPPRLQIRLNYMLQACCQEDAFMHTHQRILRTTPSQLVLATSAILQFMNLLIAYMAKHDPSSRPDVISFNYLARLTKCTSFENVQAFLNNMHHYGVTPNTKTFVELVRGLDYSSAALVFAEADRRHLQTDASILMSYIRSCQTRSDTAAANADAIKAFLSNRFRCEMYSPTYADSGVVYCLSATYKVNKDVASGKLILADMHRNAYHPPVDRFFNFIEMACYFYQPDLARDVAIQLSDLSLTYLSPHIRLAIVVGYCTMNRPDSALDFISAMRKRGLEPTLAMTLCLVTRLIALQRLGDADRVARQMQNENATDRPILPFNTVTHAYIVSGRADEAKRRITTLSEFGLVADDTTSALLVAAQFSLGNDADAMQVVADLEARYGGEDQVPVVVYAACMDHYLGIGCIDRGNQYWDLLKRASAAVGMGKGIVELDDAVLARYINGVAALGHVHLVEALEHHIDSIRQPESTRELIRVYFSSDRADRAVAKTHQLVDQLRRDITQSLPPDEREAVLAAAATDPSNTRLAVAVAGARGQYRTARDIKTSQSIAHVLCDCISYFSRVRGDWSTARYWLRIYLSLFRPTATPFVALIRAAVSPHCSDSDADGLQLAQSVWDEMVSCGVRQNARSYGALIAAHIDAGDLHTACDLITDMVQDGFSPGRPILNTVLGLLGRGRRVSDMEILFQRLSSPRRRLGALDADSREDSRKDSEKDYRRDPGEIGIAGLSLHQTLSKHVDVIVPGLPTINALLTGYLHSGHYARIFLVWNRLWRKQGGRVLLRRSLLATDSIGHDGNWSCTGRDTHNIKGGWKPTEAVRDGLKNRSESLLENRSERILENGSESILVTHDDDHAIDKLFPESLYKRQLSLTSTHVANWREQTMPPFSTRRGGGGGVLSPRISIWEPKNESSMSSMQGIADPLQPNDTHSFRVMASPVTSSALFSQSMTVEMVFGVSPITVCLVLDAAGFSRNLPVLDKLWRDLEVAQFPLSVNCYTSYMEALVRCGEVHRACAVITGHGSGDANGGDLPDLKMVDNFLKMCGDAYASETESVWAYVRQRCPDKYISQLEKRMSMKQGSKIRNGSSTSDGQSTPDSRTSANRRYPHVAGRTMKDKDDWQLAKRLDSIVRLLDIE
ncbi:hypothetical protein BASA50_003169 [Batrachochytrium salamandrivorans]|uniref:Pentacotripeptide-repeat region of PRORP domain-containing protein n=1 Tax=Batrachochytrium salamandrivorans TaxID=1357716 RepID=A0ABQ8FJ77_9FUNG|nr:hypothetical protein BASA50_003169 [Batrachochytrium salamandrivorans]